MLTISARSVCIGLVLPLCALTSSVQADVWSRTEPITGNVEIHLQDNRGIDEYSITNPANNVVEEADNGGCQSDVVVPMGPFKDHDHTHLVDYTPCDESPNEAWMTHYYPEVFDGEPWVPGVPRHNQAAFIQLGDVNNDGFQDTLVTREFTGTLSVFVNQGDGTLSDAQVYPLNPSAPTLELRDKPPSIEQDAIGIAFQNSDIPQQPPAPKTCTCYCLASWGSAIKAPYVPKGNNTFSYSLQLPPKYTETETGEEFWTATVNKKTYSCNKKVVQMTQPLTRNLVHNDYARSRSQTLGASGWSPWSPWGPYTSTRAYTNAQALATSVPASLPMCTTKGVPCP